MEQEQFSMLNQEDEAKWRRNGESKTILEHVCMKGDFEQFEGS